MLRCCVKIYIPCAQHHEVLIRRLMVSVTDNVGKELAECVFERHLRCAGLLLVYCKSRGKIFLVDRRVSSLDSPVLHTEVHPLSHPHKQTRLNHTFEKRERQLICA